MDATENQAIIDEVRRNASVEFFKVDGFAEVASVPQGRTLQSLKCFTDEHADAPDRRRGTATLSTIESFIAHVNRFKDSDSAIFAEVANRLSPKLVAILDYHCAGGPAVGAPRFGEHRSCYSFPVSDEWRAWTTAKEMTQAAFAEFLEERIVDVLDSTQAGKTASDLASQLGITLAGPQRLLELSRGLTIAVGSKVTQHVNLSTGEAQIGFEESHSGAGGSQLKIPGGFVIAIPVFKKGPLYQLPVRLRYRVANGGVTWWFSPQQTDRVWDHVLDEACTQAKEETQLPLFYGMPE